MQNSWLLIIFPCNTVNASLSSCLHGFWPEIWFGSYCCWSRGKMLSNILWFNGRYSLFFVFYYLNIMMCPGVYIWYLYCFVFPETLAWELVCVFQLLLKQSSAFSLMLSVPHYACGMSFAIVPDWQVFVHSFFFAHWLQKFLLTCL